MRKLKNFKSKTRIGDKHGKLTVIDEPYSTDHLKNNHFYCKVKCECGTIFTTKCTRLRNNNTFQCKNCGFKDRSIRNTVPQIEQIFRRLVLDRSVKKNLGFVSITAQDYFRITSQNCYYCGDPPKEVREFKNRKYVNTEKIVLNGMDRVDSNKGYHLDNIVSCCTSCNYAKHKLSQKEFLDKISKIYKNRILK